MTTELKPTALLFLFFSMLFLLNYYDLYFIQVPARASGPPALYSFAMASTIYFFVNIFKFILLSCIMYAVALLFNMQPEGESGLPLFKNVVGVVVLIEFVFLFEKIYRIYYFSHVSTNYITADLSSFHPLSLYREGSGSRYLNMIFEEFSLFTVMYVIAMIVAIHIFLGLSKPRSFSFAMISYVLPLLVWISVKYMLN